METTITIKKQANEVLNPFLIRNKSKALQLALVFKPMTLAFEAAAKEIEQIKKDYEGGFTKEIGERARACRLQLVTIRTSTEKLKKEEKAEYLLATKAIDGLNNIIKMATTLDERDLKEIETHELRAEAAKVEKLQSERADKIRDYAEDPEVLKLGEMDPDMFEAYYLMKKNKSDAKKAADAEIETLRLQKLAEAEAERLAQAVENAKLKAEAVKQKAKQKAIDEEREAKQKAIDDKREAEAAEAAAKQKAIDDKREAEAAKERAAALVIANKLKAIEEEKAKAIEEKKKKSEELARASDEQKIQLLANELNMIVASLPEREFSNIRTEAQIKFNLNKLISSLYETK